MEQTPGKGSRRLLIMLSALVLILMIAGAVSFARYARTHAPNPTVFAVAPFDIFVAGLEPWRVKLAEGLTAQLSARPPLSAIPQTVVRERWRGTERPTLDALDLARRSGAGVAIYGRLDPPAAPVGKDSVRVQVIAVEATSGRVLVSIDRRWPVVELDRLAPALAEEVAKRAALRTTE
jgi:hypothetical protein